MKLLKLVTLLFTGLIISACGTTSTIDPKQEFDLWDYMTSSFNFEVQYQSYANNIPNGIITETHIANGNQYFRNHSDGSTTEVLTNGNNMLMIDPNGVQTNIIRYVYLGDRGVFQSSSIQLCTFGRFYDSYQTHGSQFYNVIQIACTSNSGVYQEFYYGYDEGLVAFYQNNGSIINESIKISDRRI